MSWKIDPARMCIAGIVLATLGVGLASSPVDPRKLDGDAILFLASNALFGGGVVLLGIGILTFALGKLRSVLQRGK